MRTHTYFRTTSRVSSMTAKLWPQNWAIDMACTKSQIMIRISQIAFVCIFKFTRKEAAARKERYDEPF